MLSKYFNFGYIWSETGSFRSNVSLNHSCQSVSVKPANIPMWLWIIIKLCMENLAVKFIRKTGITVNCVKTKKKYAQTTILWFFWKQKYCSYFFRPEAKSTRYFFITILLNCAHKSQSNSTNFKKMWQKNIEVLKVQSVSHLKQKIQVDFSKNRFFFTGYLVAISIFFSNSKIKNW